MSKNVITRAKAERAARYTSQTYSDIAKGRYALQNVERVKRQARGRTSYDTTHGGVDWADGDFQEGSNLKSGIMGMASKAAEHLSDEDMAKLNAMDEQALSALYQNNKMVFEVAFNYGGVSRTSHGDVVDASKGDDMRFLIQQYERNFGKIQL